MSARRQAGILIRAFVSSIACVSRHTIVAGVETSNGDEPSVKLRKVERVCEKPYSGAIRFSIKRMAAISIIVSDVCT